MVYTKERIILLEINNIAFKAGKKTNISFADIYREPSSRFSCGAWYTTLDFSYAQHIKLYCVSLKGMFAIGGYSLIGKTSILHIVILGSTPDISNAITIIFNMFDAWHHIM